MLYNQKKCYYTIIELFVATAIILVLFTLLTPALKKNMEFARSHKCANHQRGIYISFELYENDYYFLPAAHQIIKGDKHHFWYEAIIPYQEKAESMLDDKFQWCPSIEEISPNVNSYAMNSFHLIASKHNLEPSKHNSDDFNPSYFIRLDSYSDISKPSNTLLLSDHGRNIKGAWTHPVLRRGIYFDGIRTNIPSFRHLGFKNVIFLDGHIGRHTKGDFAPELVLRDDAF